MTDTSRTTVTFTTSIMREIEVLIGVFGATRAQVISNIVEYFLNDKKNDALIAKLKERKREQNKPDGKIIGEKIKYFLKGTNYIPLETFLKNLGIGEKYFYENNHIWSEKYNYTLQDLKIVKNI